MSTLHKDDGGLGMRPMFGFCPEPDDDDDVSDADWDECREKVAAKVTGEDLFEAVAEVDDLLLAVLRAGSDAQVGKVCRALLDALIDERTSREVGFAPSRSDPRAIAAKVLAGVAE